MATDASALRPEQWGPKAWAFLHAMSFGLPDDCLLSTPHRTAICALLRSLGDLLPCEICRKHIQAELRQDPPEGHCEHAKHVQVYLWTVHNRVNARLGKPEFGWDALCEQHTKPTHGMCGAAAPGPTPVKKCALLRGSRDDSQVLLGGYGRAALFAGLALALLVTFAAVWRCTASRRCHPPRRG